MSSNNHLPDHIKTLFLQKLNMEVPSVDTDLLDTGLLDSLQLVELLVVLEQEFGTTISFDEIELDNFRTIRNIAHLIEHNQASHTPSGSPAPTR